jgi:hypothetical protein
MKKIIKTSILILFLSFYSCSEESILATSEKDYLIGNWRIIKVKTFNYLNNKLDNVEEKNFDKPNQSKLNFEENGNVSYLSPEFIKEINGIWNLNNKVLKTDLNIDLTSAGYGIRYFFPENEIILINKNQLTLKSPMSLESVIQPNGNKIKFYTETYLEK